MNYKNMYLSTGILVTILVMAMPVMGELVDDELKVFLGNDLTDRNEYTPYYTCGHFARELTANALASNITLGVIILGKHPTLRGYQNHIMNYVYINGVIVIIEPQTDEIYILRDYGYCNDFMYYRMYPEGQFAPSNWAHSLSTQRVSQSTVEVVSSME